MKRTNLSKILKSTLSAAAATGLLLGATSVSAARTMTHCEMTYDLKGWSFAIKVQKGEGRIVCDNGQRAKVDLTTNAIGFTIGKGEIIGGKADFTPVKGIDDLLGQYVALQAHAGAARSAEAGVLTKGEVSMALSGTGNGVDAGATIGAFTIARK